MKKIVFGFVFILVQLSCRQLNAQAQFSGWLASFNTVKTGKKTSIHADFQLRSTDELTHTQTLLLRSGLNVHLRKSLTLTAGYAFINNRRVIGGVSGYSPEHRLWEQLIISHKIGHSSMAHRFRLEQRFIEKRRVNGNELAKDGSFYASRIRYFFRDVLPFSKGDSFTKGFFGALQNEVFLHLGNTTNLNGKTFDQNRLYLALGYRINSTVDVETGYMNQYVSGRGDSFTNNHIWQLAAYLRL